MWVKICANTNLEDALSAVALGADAVGFVLAPSKRQVTAAQVAAISAQLPSHVERVGVFLSSDAETAVAAVREAGLTSVQMHGGIQLESAGRIRERLGSQISLIHVAHWQVDGGDEAERAIRAQLEALALAELSERVLIDAKVGIASGGLGVSFDWHRAQRVVADFPMLKIIIAGGLRPENVAEAVTLLRPYGVDVASGVEAEPGRKDRVKLESFIENARRA